MSSRGRGVFTPVKVGIAGEQYFEVLDGLKAGDSHHRPVQLGARALGRRRREGAAEQPESQSADDQQMNQVLDSILIALQAIWANKLRSFMTVLGNIVAVTRSSRWSP